MKIIINGFSGSMGQTIYQLSKTSDNIDLVAGIDKHSSLDSDFLFQSLDDFKGQAHVLIDFSRPEALDSILEYGKRTKTPLVIGTTGYSEDQLEKIRLASQSIAIFHSSNMSLGVNLMLDLVYKASKVLNSYDIEVLEAHHNRKVDAPSGTALMIADSIKSAFDGNKYYKLGRDEKNRRREKEEIGIHAIRGGTIVGEHRAIFAGIDEILEIKHTALSKNVFAEGALEASYFIRDKETGLYSMEDLINC